jgi:hypothetical protein
MKAQDVREVKSSVRWRRGAALLLVCTAACTVKTGSGSLKGFAQSSNKTLVEITDTEGRPWKILSADAASFSTYVVLNPSSRVDLTATVFADRTGARNAVVRVDANEKEDVLAVLDKKFLTGLTNQTEAYKNWAAKEAIFTYGAVQVTSTLDVKDGSLGAGTASAEGGKIVVQLAPVACHCYDRPSCSTTTDPVTAECINRVCDFLNCIFSGTGSSCGDQLATATTACNLATHP